MNKKLSPEEVRRSIEESKTSGNKAKGAWQEWWSEPKPLPDSLSPEACARTDAAASVDRSSSGHLISRRAADIKPRCIDFLWAGRLARGKHTAFAGEPGDGKSQLSVYVAATISRGSEWPCGEGRAPVGNVIIIHVANGGYRRPTEAAILKGLGVVAGVPDVILIHRGRCYA